MGRVVDETGHIYGRLTVIERVENSKHRVARWLCQCSCGNTYIATGRALRKGGAQSCGCLQYEANQLPPGQAAFNALYRKYLQNAAKKNLEFALTKEDFSFLTKMNCHYCGTVPGTIIRSRANSDDYIYNGLDRVDSGEGYIMSNVVPCCKMCNMAKRDTSKQEFFSWIDRVYNHRHLHNMEE